MSGEISRTNRRPMRRRLPRRVIRFGEREQRRQGSGEHDLWGVHRFSLEEVRWERSDHLSTAASGGVGRARELCVWDPLRVCEPFRLGL